MKIYLYDSSFEGLLTAIFYAYVEKGCIDIQCENTYIPHLMDEPLCVPTEEDKFTRVYDSIEHKLGALTLKNVYYLYLSNRPSKEKLIYDYLKLCFKYSSDINLAKNNDTIHLVDTYVRQVSLEAHRFYGFVRFREVIPNVFYATIEPDHNILPLIMAGFAKRFSDQHFIIHDLIRNWAIVYDLEEVYLKELPSSFHTSILQDTSSDEFEDLFKTFYKNTTISERYNPRLQKGYMPSRYWKHLFEVKE